MAGLICKRTEGIWAANHPSCFSQSERHEVPSADDNSSTWTYPGELFRSASIADLGYWCLFRIILGGIYFGHRPVQDMLICGARGYGFFV